MNLIKFIHLNNFRVNFDLVSDYYFDESNQGDEDQQVNNVSFIYQSSNGIVLMKTSQNWKHRTVM